MTQKKYLDLHPGMMLIEVSHFANNVVKYRLKVCLSNVIYDKKNFLNIAPRFGNQQNLITWIGATITFVNGRYFASHNFTFNETRSSTSYFHGTCYLFDQDGTAS